MATYNFGFTPANTGFSSRFNLAQPYSPTLSQANLTPGQVDLSGQQAAQLMGGTSWPGQGTPMQQQMPAGGGGLSASTVQQLLGAAGGILGASHPQPQEAPVAPMPQMGYTANNGALQRLLSMYGIHGGLLGG